MSWELSRQSYFVFCLLVGGRVGWVLLPGLKHWLLVVGLDSGGEGRLLFDRKWSFR